MRKFSKAILLFLLLSNQLLSSAQNGKEEAWSTNFFNTIRTNYLSNQPDSVFSIPFKTIDFLDARFDTSSIGYTLHSNNYYRKLSTKEGLEQLLQSKLLKDNTGKNNSLGILCVIHNFKVMETDSVPEKHKDNTIFFNKLVTKVDIFVNDNNQYKAASRFDTMFMDYVSNKEDKNHIISLFAKALSTKISNINVVKTLSKKAYAFTDIKESVDDKINLPVIKAAAFTKGVYLTFDEFVNNKPSYSNYKIKKGKFVDDIYIEGADSIPSIARNVFGYSDGKKFWIKLGNNVFLLHRTGNEFAFLGFASLGKVQKLRSSGIGGPTLPLPDDGRLMPSLEIPNLDAASPIQIGKNNLNMQSFRPFVIDMEKGIIF